MPTIELAEFVVMEHIPLLETGIAYPASTGPFTPTSSMLLEAVEAQDDPHVPAPRLKIGHMDNPLNDELQAAWDEINAAAGLDNASEPALGTILNMSLENAGHTLYGDLHGLPAWLAAILETAYPSRSIEGGQWGAWDGGEVTTANEKRYKFCLAALALLGVAWPGCTSLADLQELFSAGGPQVTVIEMPKPKSIAAAAGRSEDQLPVIAQVNIEDIRRAFYDDFAQDERYWWWDRELLVDPLELIVQDPDEGQLYRVAVTTSGDDGPDSVTFGDPEAIKIKYVPDKKSEQKAMGLIAPQLEGAGAVLAVNTTPPRTREREEARMELNIPQLRERLGLTAEQLPDEATEEQINEVLAETPAPTPPEGTPPEGTPPEGTPPEEDEDEAGNGGSPQAATVDPAALAQLQADAAMGRQARQAQLTSERTTFVEAAIRAGKFPPTSRDAYLAQLSQGGQIEANTRKFIDDLTPGVVPVGELGGDGDVTAAATDYIDTHLSPEERSRIEAASNGQNTRNRIVTEA